jgi:hypothetical protein
MIHDASRPLSAWTLRPLLNPPSVPYPDIVAQTTDANGKVLGTWDGDSPIENTGVQQHFYVHEDLLEGKWGMENWRSRKVSDYE